MRDRPLVGTRSPSRQEIVLDVPENAHVIALGILLAGTGEAILASPAFDVVGNDVAVTGHGLPPLGDFKP